MIASELGVSERAGGALQRARRDQRLDRRRHAQASESTPKAATPSANTRRSP
jgi:hypothetical protein